LGAQLGNQGAGLMTQLNLDHSAPLDELKKKVKRILFKNHPDKGEGNVNVAQHATDLLHLLNNPELYEIYDEALKANKKK
jgi:hypothetical protein